MELWEFGKEHTKKRACVNEEVRNIVFGVETGQDVPRRARRKGYRLQ